MIRQLADDLGLWGVIITIVGLYMFISGIYSFLTDGGDIFIVGFGAVLLVPAAWYVVLSRLRGEADSNIGDSNLPFKPAESLYEALGWYRLHEADRITPFANKDLSDWYPQEPSGHVQCGICGDSMGVSHIFGWCGEDDKKNDIDILLCEKCYREGIDRPVYRFATVGNKTVMPVRLATE